jgi:hypothetical protein
MRAKPWEVPNGLWERIEPLPPPRQRRFRYPGRRPFLISSKKPECRDHSVTVQSRRSSSSALPEPYRRPSRLASPVFKPIFAQGAPCWSPIGASSSGPNPRVQARFG